MKTRDSTASPRGRPTMLLQIQPPDKDLEGEPVAVSLTKSEVFIYAIPERLVLPWNSQPRYRDRS